MSYSISYPCQLMSLRYIEIISKFEVWCGVNDDESKSFFNDTSIVISYVITHTLFVCMYVS